MIKKNAQIISQKEIAKDIFEMWIHVPEISCCAQPGQFISLYCRDKTKLLPRPFGICQTDEENGNIAIVYKIVGGGTKEFSTYSSEESVEIIGPLGKGFEKREGKGLLIGGGTGVPILVELAKRLDNPLIVAGFRDEPFLVQELSAEGELYISTEDGSQGTRGNVMNVLNENEFSPEYIYACGPHVMLRAIKEYASAKKIPAWFSLEEKMACGIGACLGCTCKTVDTDEVLQVKNKRVCKEGPVFFADEVEL